VKTEAILDVMKEVAEAHIRPRFRALADDQIFLKAPHDYVTVADREAEVALTAVLQRAFPDAAVIGEEATAANPDLTRGIAAHAHAFTVDPVDGTHNFVKGKPDYAVMIGELRHGVATRGWIWQPELGRAYVAERGAGVQRDGVTLNPVPRTGRPRGTSSVRPLVGHVTPSLAEPVGATHWCAGFDYTDLLEGQTDFVLFNPPKPWDHIPGVLMLRELGGVARTTDGRDYAPDVTAPTLIVAANEDCYQAALTVTNPLSS
jgi:fructose-1,6-bisphosphatase/inositol monophosphatase family enzyme